MAQVVISYKTINVCSDRLGDKSLSGMLVADVCMHHVRTKTRRGVHAKP